MESCGATQLPFFLGLYKTTELVQNKSRNLPLASVETVWHALLSVFPKCGVPFLDAMAG